MIATHVQIVSALRVEEIGEVRMLAHWRIKMLCDVARVGRA